MTDIAIKEVALREAVALATLGPWGIDIDGGSWIFSQSDKEMVLYYTNADNGIYGNKDGDIPAIVALRNDAIPIIDALHARIAALVEIERYEKDYGDYQLGQFVRAILAKHRSAAS